MANNKILIIDDDKDILDTMGTLLSNEGFEIHSAEDVEKEIQMLKEVSPDLILLDFMFPEKKVHGFEAANEIKEKYPRLPIIMFNSINTVYAFDFTKEDIKVDEFVDKPVDIDELVKLIKKYI